jgi:hypothetical protein
MASPAELRQQFSEETAAAAQVRQDRALSVSRLMIADMADGAEFTHEDFLFAATAGNPANYPWHAKILERASKLKAGDIVGIAQGDALLVLGQLAEDPLGFEVRLHPDEPHNRTLTAFLKYQFTTSTHVNRETGRGPAIVSSEPTRVPILENNGEWRSSHDFAFGNHPYHTEERPHIDLLIGASAIIDKRVITNQKGEVINDPDRRARVDLLFTHLAQLAMPAAAEKV